MDKNNLNWNHCKKKKKIEKKKRKEEESNIFDGVLFISARGFDGLVRRGLILSVKVGVSK
jgi:hypothetical protein